MSSAKQELQALCEAAVPSWVWLQSARAGNDGTFSGEELSEALDGAPPREGRDRYHRSFFQLRSIQRELALFHPDYGVRRSELLLTGRRVGSVFSSVTDMFGNQQFEVWWRRHVPTSPYYSSWESFFPVFCVLPSKMWNVDYQPMIDGEVGMDVRRDLLSIASAGAGSVADQMRAAEVGGADILATPGQIADEGPTERDDWHRLRSVVGRSQSPTKHAWSSLDGLPETHDVVSDSAVAYMTSAAIAPARFKRRDTYHSELTTAVLPVPDQAQTRMRFHAYGEWSESLELTDLRPGDVCFFLRPPEDETHRLGAVNKMISLLDDTHMTHAALVVRSGSTAAEVQVVDSYARVKKRSLSELNSKKDLEYVYGRTLDGPTPLIVSRPIWSDNDSTVSKVITKAEALVDDALDHSYPLWDLVLAGIVLRTWKSRASNGGVRWLAQSLLDRKDQIAAANPTGTVGYLCGAAIAEILDRADVPIETDRRNSPQRGTVSNRFGRLWLHSDGQHEWHQDASRPIMVDRDTFAELTVSASSPGHPYGSTGGISLTQLIDDLDLGSAEPAGVFGWLEGDARSDDRSQPASLQHVVKQLVQAPDSNELNLWAEQLDGKFALSMPTRLMTVYDLINSADLEPLGHVHQWGPPS